MDEAASAMCLASLVDSEGDVLELVAPREGPTGRRVDKANNNARAAVNAINKGGVMSIDEVGAWRW